MVGLTLLSNNGIQTKAKTKIKKCLPSRSDLDFAHEKTHVLSVAFLFRMLHQLTDTSDQLNAGFGFFTLKCMRLEAIDMAHTLF